MKNDFSSHAMDVDSESQPRNLVQCRICHEEDDDSNVEAPCSCCGSLKYAHRKCVQRWCNEKGDIICEICHQQFRPGYTAPPPLFHYSGISMNFRGNWEVSRSDLNNPQFLDMFATDHNFVDTVFDDYSAFTSRSLICTRIVAITFLVLLVLRHILQIILGRDGDYTFMFSMILLLRIMAIIFLPVYIVVKACTAIRRQQHLQEARNFSAARETELRQLESQPHLIHIQ